MSMWRKWDKLPEVSDAQFPLHIVALSPGDGATAVILTHTDTDGWVYCEDGEPIGYEIPDETDWAELPKDFVPAFWSDCE